MTPFEERLKIGDISEKKFENQCVENKINFVSTKNFNGWTNDFDKINGDYIIISSKNNRIFRIDVKGGAISKDSIEEFKGDFFVIYENSNKSGISGLVFASSFLKTLIKDFKLSDFDVLIYSKDPGILFSRLKSYVDVNSDYNSFRGSVMKIDDFLKNF